MIFIKNNTTEVMTWLGKTFSAGEIRNVEDSDTSRWSSSSEVITAIVNGDIIISKDGTSAGEILDINEAIDFLKGVTPVEVNSTNYAFFEKRISDGSRVFTRIVGIKQNVGNPPEDIVYNIPYDKCKITGIEVLNCNFGDKVSFFVKDTPVGTLSGTPDLELNRFGEGVYLPEGHYRYESKYDADLIKDMKLVVNYDAIDSLLPKDVYINFILHEIKE